MIAPVVESFASPKPMPNAEITSPGLAGRNGTPGIRLVLPTYVTPSLNRATMYCLPMLNDAGASIPGTRLALVIIAGMLVVLQLVTVMETGPLVESAGA